MLAIATQRADEAEAELANARARESAAEAMIAHLKLQNAKLRREQFGPSAERTERLLAQMELELEDLEADAAEDELAAEAAAAKTSTITAFERKKPVRKPFPDHLPRERVVVPAPCSCPACGGDRLSKLGEDVTETLEVIPRSWKVIQTVREKFACRDCEKITQPPAPFHVTPRGWAGPSFLAMLLFDKYGQHQPLHRQAERFASEGVPLSVSTLAEQIGAACLALMPIFQLIEAHSLAFCWSHVRRRFYELADKSPVATEILRRIAMLYAVEDEVRGSPAEQRSALRAERSRIVVDDLKFYLDARLRQVSAKSKLAEAIRYALGRWDGLARFLDDGRVDLDTNTVERSIRPLALNGKNALFAGSDEGGDNWAVIATLIENCKLSGINPHAWLAQTLTKLANGHPVARLTELMPWTAVA